MVTTTLDAGELTQRFPQVLPGGKALLYTSLSPQGDFDFDKGNLVVQPLPNGVRKVVQRGAYFGRYVPSGHLVFLHNGTLFAEAFDLAHLEVTSSPVPVIDSISTNTTLGAGLFAVSNAGMLSYTPAESASTRTRPSNGWTAPERPPPYSPHLRTGPISRSRLMVAESPSTSGTANQPDIWVADLGTRRAGAADDLQFAQQDAGVDAGWTPHRIRLAERRATGRHDLQPLLAAGRWFRGRTATDNERQPAGSGLVASEREGPRL